MHGRTLLVLCAAVAIVVVLVAAVARSRSTEWHRYIGSFLPGWPWW
jgi:hypothetical protein